MGALLLGALLARVVLVYTSPGHGYDQLTFWRWAGALAHHSIGEFYSIVPDADHLPGDLYVHAALARVADASQGLQDQKRYVLLVKWCALTFDVVLAALTYHLVRRGGDGWRPLSSLGRRARPLRARSDLDEHALGPVGFALGGAARRLVALPDP
ncbi:hypothetical protein GCM10025862_16300 [Arsenicicoccus piscis]|uniref:Uncharacterized protein n=1 Tax=Arsenicicoccus piscis TaxID=673954 RepID=A0ABQ6HQ90_9MICO|nr:hypothetical protein GCM10025862_16300 [Arsenicicoccus piscis]